MHQTEMQNAFKYRSETIRYKRIFEKGLNTIMNHILEDEQSDFRRRRSA